MHFHRRDLLSTLLLQPLLGCDWLAARGRESGTPRTSTEILRLDGRVRHQVFEGFGAAITAWVSDLQPYYQSERFSSLVASDLGASVLRIDLWEGSVPEVPTWSDISKERFLLTGKGARGSAWLSAAENLVRAQPGKLRVIASVWSPPSWMKINRQRGHGGGRDRALGLSSSDLGQPGPGPRSSDDPERNKYLHDNRLRPDRYLHFAKAMVEWTLLLRSRGIDLYGLSLQNEPKFSHWFESCTYTPAELAELHRVVLDMFQRQGVSCPKFFLPETMSHDLEANRLYVRKILEDAKVAAHVRAIATHGYVDGYKADDDRGSLGKMRALAAPHDQPVWLTEGATGDHAWPAPLHSLGGALMNALIDAGASLITPWQFVGEKPTEHDLATTRGPTKKTFVAGQFFRHIRPAMTRVEVSSPKNPRLRCVAFQGDSPETFTAVLLNRSSHSIPVRLEFGEERLHVASGYVTDASRNHEPFVPSASLDVPEESVVTLILKRPHRPL